MFALLQLWLFSINFKVMNYIARVSKLSLVSIHAQQLQILPTSRKLHLTLMTSYRVTLLLQNEILSASMNRYNPVYIRVCIVLVNLMTYPRMSVQHLPVCDWICYKGKIFLKFLMQKFNADCYKIALYAYANLSI